MRNEYDFNPTLEALYRQHAEAIQQRDFWTTRVLQIEQAIRGLANVTAQSAAVSQFQLDLGEAILIALRNAGQQMSPTDIRNTLVAMGADLKRFRNPMAAIHSSLQRLLRKNLVILFTGGRWAAAPSQMFEVPTRDSK